MIMATTLNKLERALSFLRYLGVSVEQVHAYAAVQRCREFAENQRKPYTMVEALEQIALEEWSLYDEAIELAERFNITTSAG
jgi:hypothetical protein